VDRDLRQAGGILMNKGPRVLGFPVKVNGIFDKESSVKSLFLILSLGAFNPRTLEP
jgi:hypothetical protein